MTHMTVRCVTTDSIDGHYGEVFGQTTPVDPVEERRTNNIGRNKRHVLSYTPVGLWDLVNLAVRPQSSSIKGPLTGPIL